MRSPCGKDGKAQIQGEDLNREVLMNVTRSTASLGNNASAQIIKSKFDKKETVNLKGVQVKKTYDEEDHNPEIVLEDLTALYNKVRNNG